MATDVKTLGSFVWSIAELLRGDFKQSEYGSASLQSGEVSELKPIPEFEANPYTEEEEKSLSEIIDPFNERHGTNFTREDFLRCERVNREIMDEDMTEMMRNNPAMLSITPSRRSSSRAWCGCSSKTTRRKASL